ncbi:MAG: hypothetical protein HY331_08560 [Chloroflexi bacterium]|nr:hypothetical protein [Chloroflexota bacterium]
MQVEWLILADAAQVVGGKLYLLGGGWDVLTVNAGFPVEQRCAVAAAFKVPWNETNQPYDIKIEITDEDRHEKLFQLAGQIEVGRPPGIPPGSDQRTQIAVDLTMKLEHPGTYVIIAEVEGQESSTTFRVVPRPTLAPSQRP